MEKEQKETPAAQPEQKPVEKQDGITDIFASIKSEVLTEDVKSKIAVLIEATITEKTKAKIAELDAKFEDYKKEQVGLLESRAVDYVDSYLIEKLNDYMEHVADAYITENKLEIETGLKADLYESLVKDFRNVLAKNAIPEAEAEASDKVLQDLEAKKTELNKAIHESIELKKQIKGIRAKQVFDRLCEGLTISQKGRVENLSSDFEIDNIEEFGTKVKTLVEAVRTVATPAPAKPAVSEKPADKDEALNEGYSFKPDHTVSTKALASNADVDGELKYL